MNQQYIKKIEVGVPRLKRKIRKTAGGWKAKLIAVIIGIGLATGVIFYAFYSLSRWYDEHKIVFRNPVEVKFYQPVSILSRVTALKSPKNAPKLDTKAVERKQKEAIIERVYQATRFLESKVGFSQTVEATHVYCQQLGQINEIGYFPEGNRYFCFKDEPEQRLTFTRWLTKRMGRDYTIAEALCEYVTGNRQPQCRRSMEIGL